MERRCSRQHKLLASPSFSHSSYSRHFLMHSPASWAGRTTRHTDVPQFVRGFCPAWDVVMGSLSPGVLPFSMVLNRDRSLGPFHTEPSKLCLFGGNILWAMVYDTIYAHQDLKDDIRAGIKSLAVLYGDRTKTLLWQLLALLVVLLPTYGALSHTGFAHYVVTVGETTAFLGAMIGMVDLHTRAAGAGSATASGTQRVSLPSGFSKSTCCKLFEHGADCRSSGSCSTT